MSQEFERAGRIEVVYCAITNFLYNKLDHAIIGYTKLTDGQLA